MEKYLPDEEFTLEDIIQEFGPGPDAPPIEPVLPGMTGSIPVLTEPEVPTDAPSGGSGAVLSGENGAEHQAVLEISAPQEQVRGFAAIVRDVQEKERSLDRRFYVCIVVTAVNLLLAVYNGLGLHWIRGFENVGAMGVISLILMVCAIVTSYDVLFTGVCQLRTGRFGPELLAVAMCIAAIPEAIVAIRAERLPFAALVSLQLLCALWARQRRAETVRSIDYVLEHSGQACGVNRVEGIWKNHAAAARGSIDMERFSTMLQSDSVQRKVMRCYAPIALGLCLVLAALGAGLAHTSFFRLCTALLVVALPLSGFLCDVLPYSFLTEQLSVKKAALCGWYGARMLSGCDALLLRDAELFPEGSMRLSGVKTFEVYDSAMVMRYAAAILRAVHCDAAELLTEEEQLPELSGLRCFDEDGYSAEIGNDTVLLGSLRFMKQMGVHLEQGAKVRQALYLSVNGELAGIIALHYDALPEIRRILRRLSHGGAPTPVLVGSDVLVTPAMLRSKFRLPLKRLACPPLRERIACADLGTDSAQQGAVIAKPDLAVMGEVCLGARALVSTVLTGVVLGILAGVFGMTLVFLLCLLGELSALSCAGLLAFMLLWAAAFFLVALRVLKK